MQGTLTRFNSVLFYFICIALSTLDTVKAASQKFRIKIKKLRIKSFKFIYIALTSKPERLAKAGKNKIP